MILTNSEYPYRTTADTCCRRNTYAECVDPLNILTDATFSVGGGEGDAVLEKLASQVHPPLADLAEASKAVTLEAATHTATPKAATHKAAPKAPPTPEAPEEATPTRFDPPLPIY